MIKQIKDLRLWEIDFLVGNAEGIPISSRKHYHPTTISYYSWPIIEREKITIIYDDELDIWNSEIVMLCKPFVVGKTSLEAAMKCYLSIVYGDEVDLDMAVSYG
jgi:hypothetical protein